MNLFRSIFIICFQNIRKWTSNYRVWMIAIISILFIHMGTKQIGLFAHQVGVKASPWFFPFLYSDRYRKMLLIFPIVFLFCDAPFIDRNQTYVILRSKRTLWNLGQIMYIVVGSAIYFSFISIVPIIENIQNVFITNEWGTVFKTLASTNAAKSLGLSIFISNKILKYFTPFQAMWFTFLLSWLCGIVLGLIIYVINMVTKTRSIGIFAASFLVILSGVFYKSPSLQWFSPVSWISINNIDIGGLTNYPTFTYVITMYILLILILVVLAVIKSRKAEIVVLESN